MQNMFLNISSPLLKWGPLPGYPGQVKVGDGMGFVEVLMNGVIFPHFSFKAGMGKKAGVKPNTRRS